VDRCNAEATVEIKLVYLGESLVDILDLTVGQVVHRSEKNIATERDEERDLVHKKYVARHEDIFVKLQEVLGHFQEVPCHMDWFRSCGLAF
jgi:hypothetical protein